MPASNEMVSRLRSRFAERARDEAEAERIAGERADASRQRGEKFGRSWAISSATLDQLESRRTTSRPFSSASLCCIELALGDRAKLMEACDGGDYHPFIEGVLEGAVTEFRSAKSLMQS